MSTLIFTSVLIATLVIPLVTARDSSAPRGLRTTVIAMFAFNIIYLLAIRFLYPRLH
ncbi:MAG: hypothetical protein HUU21_10375 [Polyangiaceae bacterium]|nr:hypothetical protein [Polyangiaceae bacterium]